MTRRETVSTGTVTAAIEAARAAGNALEALDDPPTARPDEVTVTDVVTEASQDAADELVGVLSTAFPDDAIYTQETLVHNESGTERAWICDPLDGISQFAADGDEYAVSIALFDETKPILGVVYLPARGDLYTGVDGGDARKNGRTVTTSHRSRLETSTCVSGFDLGGRFLRGLEDRGATVVRQESAAVNLCELATGAADVVWEYDSYPWDVAGGLAVAEAAGAVVTDTAGNQFVPDRRPSRDHLPLLGTTPALEANLLEYASAFVRDERNAN
ncbi:inositol monophosphatase family protein [Halomontanus rarus]|uniref:inositol monophosphatase family protein n=1 Tax=Halomontanus rarus TaxID=3034020 RepID=UPI001A9967F6